MKKCFNLLIIRGGVVLALLCLFYACSEDDSYEQLADHFEMTTDPVKYQETVRDLSYYFGEMLADPAVRQELLASVENERGDFSWTIGFQQRN